MEERWQICNHLPFIYFKIRHRTIQSKMQKCCRMSAFFFFFCLIKTQQEIVSFLVSIQTPTEKGHIQERFFFRLNVIQCAEVFFHQYDHQGATCTNLDTLTPSTIPFFVTCAALGYYFLQQQLAGWTPVILSSCSPQENFYYHSVLKQQC